jgi:glycosyltransferase involved in cell wall biosynthesis
MKLYINRAPVNGPWGGGNGATKAILDRMVSYLDTSIHPQPDTVIVLGLERESTWASLEQLVEYKQQNVGVKLFIRVNDCDARKGTSDVDDRFLAASKYADGTIFVSEWMRDYFMGKGWACKNNAVIVNGVDQNVFKPFEGVTIPKPFENLRPRVVKIVTHHWSDNPLKGEDYYEMLDEFVGRNPGRFQYTFIGRTKAKLKNTQIVPPLWGRELGVALSQNDVCVNASRFDPGPNSVIESIACGLPTYVHREGGGGVEFAGLDHTFGSWDELENILTQKLSLNVFRPKTWQTFSEEVYSFLEGLSHD